MERDSVLGLVLAILCVLSIQFSCNGDVPSINCLQSDLDGLADFKSGLNDPQNRLSSWRGRSCCEWWGITCNNRTGAIIAIDLHNPYAVSSPDSSSNDGSGYWNLSGEVRPSLLKLNSLQYLDLSFNNFDHIPIPEFLGSLKSLQYLNLSNAGFSGSMPSNLGNLTNLQFLDVSSTFSALTASNLDWITGLVSLKHLSMDGVDLSMLSPNWFWSLNKLPHLNQMHLSGCSLSGSIKSLEPVNFTSLAVIDLSFNNFNSMFPGWLMNISSLSLVNLDSCGLYGRIPLGLSELPNLQHLSLAMNHNLSASCFQLFQGSWKKIQVLNLAVNRLHGRLPSSIGNMSSLTNFELSDNSIQGGIPSSIGKLCNLQNFDLSSNNLTGALPEIIDTSACILKGPLPSLMYLRLAVNHLKGILPQWLGQLGSLVELSLEYNLFHGPIPVSAGNLQNLTNVRLAGNQLNGTLPESFGQLSQLTTFDVSFNQLTGSVWEVHFSRLARLKILHLSSNSFILNVSSNWVPPFQARYIDLGSCNLGPPFPAWLRSQKEVKFLDFSNASIADEIPDWFWDISSNLSLLNVSINQLQGQLQNPLNIAPFADVDFSSNLMEGPIPLPVTGIELLDLSNNQFSGPIPQNISECMPDLIFFSLSRNLLVGNIPISLGNMLSLQVIDLSRNSLTGNIPSTIASCSFLKALDLSHNNLAGAIPASLGQLNQLQSLHLNNNNLSGSLPSSFKNLSALETLDVRNNRLSGTIQPWFGDSFQYLRILSLRSNEFSGEIPSALSNLSSLQVLDLAENNFSGTIPPTLGSLKAMSKVQDRNTYLLYGKYRGIYYEESLTVSTKGGNLIYNKTLSLVTSIDLSSNNLHGVFPEEITKLVGLVFLNLSENHLTGNIPAGISNMRQLSSLDLSSNRLSGAIPSTMSALSFLGYLHLSYNNLSGAIPYTGHMTTFDASAFAGNSGLCGSPLVVQCQGNDTYSGVTREDGSDDDDGFIDKWFYFSVALGFIAGIAVPMFVLAIRKSWRDSYFVFVDKAVQKLMQVKI